MITDAAFESAPCLVPEFSQKGGDLLANKKDSLEYYAVVSTNRFSLYFSIFDSVVRQYDTQTYKSLFLFAKVHLY